MLTPISRGGFENSSRDVPRQLSHIAVTDQHPSPSADRPPLKG